MPFQPFKTLSRRSLLDLGRYLSVENHTIQLPDGRIIPDWAWIITPDYANIIARTVEGRFLVFRQTKYAVEGETLAVIGGFIETGEDPLTAAQRELHEETGYTAPQWVSLGRYAVDANRGCGTAHLYLALDAVFSSEGISDDLEEQELLLLSADELRSALLAGAFKVLPWPAIVSLALLYLQNRP